MDMLVEVDWESRQVGTHVQVRTELVVPAHEPSQQREVVVEERRLLEQVLAKPFPELTNFRALVIRDPIISDDVVRNPKRRLESVLAS